MARLDRIEVPGGGNFKWMGVSHFLIEYQEFFFFFFLTVTTLTGNRGGDATWSLMGAVTPPTNSQLK